jgi:uncharacterized RDD family membrane protein YckC
MNAPEPPGTGYAPPDPSLAAAPPVTAAQPSWGIGLPPTAAQPPIAGPPPWSAGPPPIAAPPQDRLGRRVSAALADVALLAVLFVSLGLATGGAPAQNLPPGAWNVSAGAVHFGTWWIGFGEVTVAGWWLAGYLAVLLLYYFLLEAATGQTLGKRLLGLRVVACDGTRPSAAAIAARTLLRLVDWLPLLYLAGFITVLATGRRRQRLGDLAARTRVTVAPGVPAVRWPAVLAGILASLAILGLSVRVTSGGPAGQATAGHPCHGVSFHHPAGLSSVRLLQHTAGSGPFCHTALFADPSDGIVVEGYLLPAPVTAASLPAFARFFTSAVRQLAARAGGALQAGPQRTTVGGLPTLKFQISGRSYFGTPAMSTLVLAFDGKTQYEIDCQYTRAHAAQVTSACGQVLRTFTVAGGPGGRASPAPGTTPAVAGSPQRWEQGLGSLQRQMNNAMPQGVVTAGSLRRTAATLRRCALQLTGLGRPPAAVLRPTYRLASRACTAFARAAAFATAAARAYHTSGPTGRSETKLLNHTDSAVNQGIGLIDHAFFGAPVLPPGYPGG